MMEKKVENVFRLIDEAKDALANPEIRELYLTECFGCCSMILNQPAASYRLFSGIPNYETIEFRIDQRTPHPDTWINQDTLLAKCYGQLPGLAKDIAIEISKNPETRWHELERRLEEKRCGLSWSVPAGAIIYRLK